MKYNARWDGGGGELMLFMRFKSGEGGMIGSLVGISRRLRGPLILPFNMASK